MILGFGQAHFDKTKARARVLIEHCKDVTTSEELRQRTKTFAIDEGLFDGKYPYMHIRETCLYSQFDDHSTMVVEGIYSHYRKDHPFAPDGFAMLDICFLALYIRDSIWGERCYITAG